MLFPLRLFKRSLRFSPASSYIYIMLVQFPFMYCVYTCTSLLGNLLTLLMYISHLDLIMSLILLVTISTASQWLLLIAK